MIEKKTEGYEKTKDYGKITEETLRVARQRIDVERVVPGYSWSSVEAVSVLEDRNRAEPLPQRIRRLIWTFRRLS